MHKIATTESIKICYFSYTPFYGDQNAIAYELNMVNLNVSVS